MSNIKSEVIPMAEPLDPIGKSGRIGLVALATDINAEQDLRDMYPHDVELFTNRVLNHNPCTVENLRAMAPDISRAAHGLVPGLDLDVLIYGCTSGTVVIGEQEVFRLLQEGRGKIPCTTPVTASVAAMQTLSARRISILTPYTKAVNDEVAGYFDNNGFDVLNIAGFAVESDVDMTFVTPESIREAALSICHKDADLLFVSCTALRASKVISEIEQALNKPVVSSNQALVWHSLELVGKSYDVSGFGSLFEKRTLKAA